MEEGRDALLQGRSDLLEGDAGAAAEAFRRAEDRFGRARSNAGNPLLRLAGWVPILGRTPDAVLHLATAGREVSAAGRAIAEGLGELPDGLASLGPRDGRIPIEPLRSFAPSVAAAAEHLRTAEDEVRRVKTTWLVGSVSRAREDLDRELAPLVRGIEASSLIIAGLPEFLGADGPRRYLFAAENPAELRGTGGLIGAVAVMTADDGRLSFTPFEANDAFPRLRANAVDPPTEEFGIRYPGAERHILVVNQTPDHPSAALALQRIYEVSRDVTLDGVITADPFALQGMLAVAGPVEHPVLGTVTSENVVPLMTNQAYALAPDSAARSRVLGDVASVVLARFLQGAPPAEAAEAIAVAAGGDHLSILTADEAFQRGIHLARSDGALPDAAEAGDALGVFVNNGGGNKVDFYAGRTIDFRVALGDAGITNATLAVEIHNGAPASGEHPYVIGPNRVAEAGENISLLDLFVPRGTELLGVELDGEPSSAVESAELGYTVMRTDLEIPSGETSRAVYRLGRSEAWTGTPARGSYRLSLAGQTTLVPTRARIQIDVPDGSSIVRTSPGVEVRGARAVWEGTLGPDLEVEVEFQKPIPARAWDAIVRFFRTRLISF